MLFQLRKVGSTKAVQNMKRVSMSYINFELAVRLLFSDPNFWRSANERTAHQGISVDLTFSAAELRNVRNHEKRTGQQVFEHTVEFICWQSLIIFQE